MLSLIIEGLGALVSFAIKTAGEAARAKEEDHAAILARVESAKAALMGERTGAHAEVEGIVAELKEENRALREKLALAVP